VSPAIKVVEFNTEKGFDIFTVNGVEYSGSGEDIEGLQGAVPKGQMTFTTDKGFQRSGFKLCALDPRKSMTYVGTFTEPHNESAHNDDDKHQDYVHHLFARAKSLGPVSPWPGLELAGEFIGSNGEKHETYVCSGANCIVGPAPAPGPAPGPAPPAPGPAPPPPPPPPAPQHDDPDAATWLKIHNYFRCIHNTPEIEWDKDVAEGSAEWAQKGQMSHSKCYKIPAPRGPSGENLAAGQRSIEAAVTAWYDESPEKGPSCGGHCTALLWKKSKALGCSKKNTWKGTRPMYVCRYAKSAANYGSKSAGVNMPDYSREPECYQKYQVGQRWNNGQAVQAASDGQGEAVTNDDPAEEADPSEPEPA